MSVRVLNHRQAVVLQFAEFVAADEMSWKHDEMCEFLDTINAMTSDFQSLDHYNELFSQVELDVLAELFAFEQAIPKPLLEGNPKCASIQDQLIEYGIRFLKSQLK